jgi:hypothetical protein
MARLTIMRRSLLAGVESGNGDPAAALDPLREVADVVVGVAVRRG